MNPAPLAGRLWGNDGATPASTPLLAGEFEGSRLLVPLLGSSVPAVTDQVRIATALARATGASLSVFDPASGADRTWRADPRAADSDRTALLEWAVERTAESSVSRGGGVFGTSGAVARVLGAVDAQVVDTLVLPGAAGGAGRFRRDAVDRIAASAKCDVVVVNGRPGYDSVPSILLPIAGGPHSGLAADVAGRVAADCDAWVDVLHVVTEDATEREREEAVELVEGAARRVGRPETTSTWVLEADDAATAIIEQSQYYGLTVVGAPTSGSLRQFIYGSTNQSVRSAARSVVLSARSYDPDPSDD